MANDRDDLKTEVVWISLPLDAETAAILQDLSDMCHADRVVVAASLLHDVLHDDREAHSEPGVARYN